MSADQDSKNNDLLEEGKNLYSAKKYEEALASYDKAIEINSENADAWNYKGHALNALSRYEEALASYDKAIEINSDDNFGYGFLINKGMVLTSLKKYEDALASYDKAIEINSRYGLAWRKKAFVFKKIRKI